MQNRIASFNAPAPARDHAPDRADHHAPNLAGHPDRAFGRALTGPADPLPSARIARRRLEEEIAAALQQPMERPLRNEYPPNVPGPALRRTMQQRRLMDTGELAGRLTAQTALAAGGAGLVGTVGLPGSLLLVSVYGVVRQNNPNFSIEDNAGRLVNASARLGRRTGLGVYNLMPHLLQIASSARAAAGFVQRGARLMAAALTPSVTPDLTAESMILFEAELAREEARLARRGPRLLDDSDTASIASNETALSID